MKPGNVIVDLKNKSMRKPHEVGLLGVLERLGALLRVAALARAVFEARVHDLAPMDCTWSET